MKLLLVLLIATPAMAQTNYHDNRFNGQMTEIYSKPIPLTANVNGYYHDSGKPVYYPKKPYQYNPQGNIGWTYNTEQYKPKDLRISR